MKAEIKNIESVFNIKKLSIPAYQRPYRWQTKNVQDLLNDLLGAFHKNAQAAYRIGTIVLHKENINEETISNIVDGQQRLVTLSLALDVLQSKIHLNFIEDLKFPHTDSQRNIFNNHHIIKNTLGKSGNTDFLKFIKEKCEVVVVSLDDLDAAFQFFDSQNSRGKSLEPYDLLKAHHLHAISAEHPRTLKFVEQWERAVSPPKGQTSLKTIISEVLFRLRSWHRGKYAPEFSSQHIHLFKGTAAHNCHPYARQQMSAYALYSAARENHFAQALPPFQIHGPLLSGEFFFEYVEHYRMLHEKLFNNGGPITSIKLSNGKLLLDFLNSYAGRSRVGDSYLRLLFECTLLIYYDRFGDAYLDKVTQKIFSWVYIERVVNPAIWFVRIEKMALDRGECGLLFHIQVLRSEERRVGKECRSRWSPYH